MTRVRLINIRAIPHEWFEERDFQTLSDILIEIMGCSDKMDMLECPRKKKQKEKKAMLTLLVRMVYSQRVLKFCLCFCEQAIFKMHIFNL